MELDDVRPLAADGVVLLDGEVVLMERDHEPAGGEWVLPGGLVEPDENAREACVREIEEEIGLVVEAERFVGLYDGPDRDPRGNVSAAYLCVPIEDGDDAEPEPREEASQVEAFDPAELPEMGFDHREIVRDAVGDR